jgi:hypothetical protein
MIEMDNMLMVKLASMVLDYGLVKILSLCSKFIHHVSFTDILPLFAQQWIVDCTTPNSSWKEPRQIWRAWLSGAPHGPCVEL